MGQLRLDDLGRVCMFLCVLCACMRVCVCDRVCVHMYVGECTCVCTFVYECVCMCMCTCSFVRAC